MAAIAESVASAQDALPVRLHRENSSRMADLWWAMQHSDDPALETFAVNLYLDESATDGGTPEAVVAGILTNRAGFLGLDESWKECLASHKLKALHMKDFGQHGSLAALQAEGRKAIFSDAVSIINKYKLYSVGASITYAKYMEKLSPAIRDAMSVYGFCFILSAYAEHLRAVHNKYDKNIGFILDFGNPYAAHVLEAHAALKRWQDTKPLNVGSLKFEDDKVVSALQAADLVAWSVRRRLTKSPFGNGFEPLLGIFDDAHSEVAWDGGWLQQLTDGLDPNHMA
jgi:hypothetical protein